MAAVTTESGISSSMADAAPVICVFCGASSGKSPAHLEAARSLAGQLHQNGARLVYGGGNIGVMGEVAKTLVKLSGPQAVHGIIPRALLAYERHANGESRSSVPDEKLYGKTTIVESMHERKQLMAREVISGGHGSGFVVLSGGFGTLEEAMENATWNQLNIHTQPVVMYNVDGYWDGLLQWVRTAVEAGFISATNQHIIVSHAPASVHAYDTEWRTKVEAKTSEEVIEKLKNYRLSTGRYGLDWEKAQELC